MRKNNQAEKVVKRNVSRFKNKESFRTAILFHSGKQDWMPAVRAAHLLLNFPHLKFSDAFFYTNFIKAPSRMFTCVFTVYIFWASLLNFILFQLPFLSNK